MRLPLTGQTACCDRSLAILPSGGRARGDPAAKYRFWGRRQQAYQVSASLCTISGENAGRQTDTYSAPPGSGVL